jgi:hypothetical protein
MADSKKEKEKIYRLRYQIYVEEMGKKLVDADHRRRLLFDDMDDSGLLFFAVAGREIVGTVRLHIGYKYEFPWELVEPMGMARFADYLPGDGSPRPLSFASKGMIVSHYRNSRAHHLLCEHYYDACRRRGVLFHFSGSAPSLVAMHEHLGARRFKRPFFVPGYGCMVPFVTILDDVDHLRRVRSPFAAAADRWPNSQEASAWFAREFPQAPARYINKQLTGEAELWRILSDKLGHRPEHAVGLFRGMSEAEARICANAGHLVYCEQGDTIVYPDDVSHEVLLIVSGSLRASSHPPDRRPSVAILRPGQVYGEKVYVARARHNTTVIAQTDTEILVLPRQAIERLTAQHPPVAAKLLHNMGFRTARKYA